MDTLKFTRLKDVIGKRPAICIEETATVAQAAQTMSSHGKGAVLVTKGQSLMGIFTERDMVWRVVAEGLDPATTLIQAVMTTRLVTGHPDDPHILALRKMVTANCRHLPVVEDSRVLGLVSRRELQALDIELLEEELYHHDPASLFL